MAVYLHQISLEQDFFQHEKTIFLQQGTYILGRENCRIDQKTFDDVSVRHVEVSVFADGIVLKDLKSEHGTFLGSKQIEPGNTQKLNYREGFSLGNPEKGGLLFEVSDLKTFQTSLYAWQIINNIWEQRIDNYDNQLQEITKALHGIKKFSEKKADLKLEIETTTAQIISYKEKYEDICSIFSEAVPFLQKRILDIEKISEISARKQDSTVRKDIHE